MTDPRLEKVHILVFEEAYMRKYVPQTSRYQEKVF